MGSGGSEDPSWKPVSFASMFQMVNSSATHMWILESVTIKTVYRTLEIIWWMPSFYRLGHWGTEGLGWTFPESHSFLVGEWGDPCIHPYCSSSLVFLPVGEANQEVWGLWQWEGCELLTHWERSVLGCLQSPSWSEAPWPSSGQWCLRPVASPFLSFIAVGPGDSAHFNNINN